MCSRRRLSGIFHRHHIIFEDDLWTSTRTERWIAKQIKRFLSLEIKSANAFFVSIQLHGWLRVYNGAKIKQLEIQIIAKKLCSLAKAKLSDLCNLYRRVQYCRQHCHIYSNARSARLIWRQCCKSLRIDLIACASFGPQSCSCARMAAKLVFMRRQATMRLFAANFGTTRAFFLISWAFHHIFGERCAALINLQPSSAQLDRFDAI